MAEAQSTDVKPINFKPLPTLRAAYSDRTAHLMAQLSGLAYLHLETPEGRANLEAAIEPSGFRLINAYWHDPDNQQAFSSDYRDLGTQAYLVEHDELAVLVFRGSTDVTDWKTNFNLRKIKVDVGEFGGKDEFVKVHRGFYEAFAQRRPMMQDDIDQIKTSTPDKPIYITGHSLGGALAQIATAAFTSDQIAACYTFGSPRAGGRHFDRFVKPPHYRITNGKDIVPFTPFFVLGYDHTGDSRHIGGNPARLFRRARSVLKHTWLFPLAAISFIFRTQFIGVRDHSIDRYAELLEQLVYKRIGLTTEDTLLHDSAGPSSSDDSGPRTEQTMV